MYLRSLYHINSPVNTIHMTTCICVCLSVSFIHFVYRSLTHSSYLICGFSISNLSETLFTCFCRCMNFFSTPNFAKIIYNRYAVQRLNTQKYVCVIAFRFQLNSMAIYCCSAAHFVRAHTHTHTTPHTLSLFSSFVFRHDAILYMCWTSKLNIYGNWVVFFSLALLVLGNSFVFHIPKSSFASQPEIWFKNIILAAYFAILRVVLHTITDSHSVWGNTFRPSNAWFYSIWQYLRIQYIMFDDEQQAIWRDWFGGYTQTSHWFTLRTPTSIFYAPARRIFKAFLTIWFTAIEWVCIVT